MTKTMAFQRGGFARAILLGIAFELLLLIAPASRVLAAEPGDGISARHQSGIITAGAPAQIIPLALSSSVVFPTTAVGATANPLCVFNCFGISGGTCNYSGAVALARAVSPPFRTVSLRKGTTNGGCNGTPVTLPVTLQAGELLLTEFGFSPTSAGNYQDTLIYSVTPTSAAADTFSWLLSGSTPAATPPSVQKYSTPTSQAGPASLTRGPDGNVWFVESVANKIGRITPSGVITEFPLPTASSFPAGIAAGVDGNLWFTEADGNKIGRITPAGAVTEFALHTAAALPGPIVPGGDGALWFAEIQYNNLAWITPFGKLAEFHLSTSSKQAGGIMAVAAGSDQSICFTENHANRIGRISSSGQFTEFNLPTANAQPAGIALGADGNFWFTESKLDGNARIGRITPTGIVTEYPISTAQSTAIAIIAGPDGALWFSWSTSTAGKIGRISTTGALTQFDLPAGMTANALAFGADGALWFTDFSGSAIGRMALTAAIRRRAAANP
ncbi:MAG: virginiamycin lyase [Thermoanaerobaculia bacterium]|jgi:streptogramin lyase|nr:virginiamycin lyase [Thermoanaerobaculia bacterium]